MMLIVGWLPKDRITDSGYGSSSGNPNLITKFDLHVQIHPQRSGKNKNKVHDMKKIRDTLITMLDMDDFSGATPSSELRDILMNEYKLEIENV